jgi:fatty acid desaturase
MVVFLLCALFSVFSVTGIRLRWGDHHRHHHDDDDDDHHAHGRDPLADWSNCRNPMRWLVVPVLGSAPFIYSKYALYICRKRMMQCLYENSFVRERQSLFIRKLFCERTAIAVNIISLFSFPFSWLGGLLDHFLIKKLNFFKIYLFFNFNLYF